MHKNIQAYGSGFQSSDSVLIFNHIPKTAGQSFTRILRNSFDDIHNAFSVFFWRTIVDKVNNTRKPQVISHHATRGIHEHLSPEKFIYYVTFLRDPRQLYQSGMRYLSRTQDKPTSEILFQKNIMTTAIGAGYYATAVFRLAKEYYLFGITEMFEESLLLLKKFIPILDLSKYYHINATPKESIEIPADWYANNEDDLRLYTFASNLFEQRLIENGIIGKTVEVRADIKFTDQNGKQNTSNRRHVGVDPATGMPVVLYFQELDDIIRAKIDRCEYDEAEKLCRHFLNIIEPVVCEEPGSCSNIQAMQLYAHLDTIYFWKSLIARARGRVVNAFGANAFTDKQAMIYSILTYNPKSPMIDEWMSHIDKTSSGNESVATAVLEGIDKLENLYEKYPQHKGILKNAYRVAQLVLSRLGFDCLVLEIFAKKTLVDTLESPCPEKPELFVSAYRTLLSLGRCDQAQDFFLKVKSQPSLREAFALLETARKKLRPDASSALQCGKSHTH
jgi:hypothetical protein